MATIIYTELGRRELSECYCLHIERGASDREAASFSGLSRRTFGRWLRQSPALAEKYERAMERRAAGYKARLRQLRRALAAARFNLRHSGGMSTLARMGARARVERAKAELAEFKSAVCCVTWSGGRRAAR